MTAAMFGGICEVCEHTYGPGDSIVPWRGHYAHERCVEERHE